MHFGYWRRGLSPLHLEPMLEEMNAQVIERLGLTSSGETIVDLGCGLGATMRTLARRFTNDNVLGITLVPWQAEQAAILNQTFGTRLKVLEANYLQTPLPSHYADAAYSLESCCHAPEESKAEFLQEVHRILRPGGRFVIADGFVRKPFQDCNPAFRILAKSNCAGWSLPCFPCLPRFLEHLETLGFVDIRVKDISWNIAPSVMQAPPKALSFLAGKVIRGEHLNKTRIAHLWSCLIACAVGLFRRDFGYFLIWGRRSP